MDLGGHYQTAMKKEGRMGWLYSLGGIQIIVGIFIAKDVGFVLVGLACFVPGVIVGIYGIIQKRNIQRREQEAAAAKEQRRQEAAAALLPIEPYSPQHIVDTFLYDKTGKTKLQLEKLWGDEFSGRSVEWQGKVARVEQTRCHSSAAGHLVEMIVVFIIWNYKYMGSGYEPISAHVIISIEFPLAQKNRLLDFSKGEIIKFGAKLPKSYGDVRLHRNEYDSFSFAVTDAYLI